MKILITGSAEFIGYNLHKFILSNPIKKNQKIVGLDNLNNYYDVKLKKKFSKLQKGDINKSYASVALLKKLNLLKNVTSVEVGIQNFISWYLKYKKISFKEWNYLIKI